MVLLCDTDCRLQRQEWDLPGRLVDGTLLYEKDRVTAGGKAGVKVVLLLGARTVRVKPGATVTVGSREVSPATAFEEVLRKKGAPALDKVPALIHSRSQAVVETFLPAMGVPKGPISPMPWGKVLSGRPTFRWSAVPGAVRYQVRVTTNFGEKHLWTATSDRNFYTPTARQALTDEQPQADWEVTAILNTGKKIRVVETTEISLLGKGDREKLTAVEPLVKSPDPEDWLLAASTYSLYRAMEDALPLYEKLATRYPGQIGVRQVLLGYYLRNLDEDRARKVLGELKKLGVAFDNGT